MTSGDIVAGNNFFETTEENIKAVGARPVALPGRAKMFPGNIDLEALEKTLKTKKVKAILVTITSNHNGGQPVSLGNVQSVGHLGRKYHALVILDACRFAENAYFNKILNQRHASIRRIALKVFDQADYIFLSTKKDGLVNTGGFIGLRQKRDFDQLNEKILLYEGFPSHGGLAGRDLATMDQGLHEAMLEEHLAFRVGQIIKLGNILKKATLPVFEPFGGHAIAIKSELLRIPYPAYALAAAVYLESGIRGGVFNNSYRLAIPRRVYTNDHLSHAAQVIADVFLRGKFLRLKVVYRPRNFFNFWVRFVPDTAGRGTGSKASQKAG